MFFILSEEDQSIKGGGGVTPLWTVFHLYNYIFLWVGGGMARWVLTKMVRGPTKFLPKPLGGNPKWLKRFRQCGF
jgi:hypothetical protein